MPLSIQETIDGAGWTSIHFRKDRWEEVPIDDLFEIRVTSCRKKNRKRLSHALIRKRDNTTINTKHNSILQLVLLAAKSYEEERRKYEMDLEKILLEEGHE